VRDLQAKDGYDLWADTYDESPNPVVDMDERHTMGILAPKPGERILDAGCGTGRNLAAMIAAGARPSGLDYSTGMLQIARERHPDLVLKEGDLQQPFPFEGESFDAVLFSLVAEHLDDPLAALREMARVLKPGGRLVFSVFHPQMAAAGMQAQFIKDGVGYRLGANPFTVADYEKWIDQAGLELTGLHEYEGDEKLVEHMPFARILVGFPVLLVMEAVKTE
jgi:ubiquinone/menaquinone biosynthesis C-methylase UbiE